MTLEDILSHISQSATGYAPDAFGVTIDVRLVLEDWRLLVNVLRGRVREERKAAEERQYGRLMLAWRNAKHVSIEQKRELLEDAADDWLDPGELPVEELHHELALRNIPPPPPKEDQ